MYDAILEGARCAAVDGGLGGRAPLTKALAGYQRDRDDAATELYDTTRDGLSPRTRGGQE